MVFVRINVTQLSQKCEKRAKFFILVKILKTVSYAAYLYKYFFLIFSNRFELNTSELFEYYIALAKLRSVSVWRL